MWIFLFLHPRVTLAIMCISLFTSPCNTIMWIFLFFHHHATLAIMCIFIFLHPRVTLAIMCISLFTSPCNTGYNVDFPISTSPCNIGYNVHFSIFTSPCNTGCIVDNPISTSPCNTGYNVDFPISTSPCNTSYNVDFPISISPCNTGYNVYYPISTSLCNTGYVELPFSETVFPSSASPAQLCYHSRQRLFENKQAVIACPVYYVIHVVPICFKIKCTLCLHSWFIKTSVRVNAFLIHSFGCTPRTALAKARCYNVLP